MIDVISPNKCNQEMSKVNFLRRMSSMVFDKFDFWPLILAGNKLQAA